MAVKIKDCDFGDTLELLVTVDSRVGDGEEVKVGVPFDGEITRDIVREGLSDFDTVREAVRDNVVERLKTVPVVDEVTVEDLSFEADFVDEERIDKE